MDIFKNIFGDKRWYQSLTAWGLIVLAAALATQDALAGQCSSGTLTGFACTTALPALKWAGGIITTLGIRKALN